MASLTNKKKGKTGWGQRARWIGTLFSIGLLIWLLAQQDWQALFDSVASIPVIYLLLSLAFMLAFQFANSARWFSLLRAQKSDVRYLRAIQLVFAGRFASNFLPSTIGGDALRAVGIYPHTPNAFTAAASVVVDRLVSVFGRLFFLPFAVPILNEAIGGLHGVQITSVFAQIPFSNLIRSSLDKIREALSLWLHNPRSLFSALIFSWVGVGMDILSTYVIAVGQGLNVSLLDITGIVALIHLVTIIPFSINAYGLREITVVAALSQIGVTPEEAAALALVTRGIALVATIPGAIWIGSLLDDWRHEQEKPERLEASPEE
jgi:uncharacterized membrane protein YbhN (UPF0104 family)